MTESRKKGDGGENFACKLLEKKGYTIKDRNYHSRYGEIDIIAQKGELLVFAEVKLRKSGSAVSGAESVTPAKQRKIVLTSYCYLQLTEGSFQPRYDVIALTEKNGEIIRAEHIPGAFTAEVVSD